MIKSHSLRTTVNIWCEGNRDASFVHYLYELYHVPGRMVKVRNAHGGDPAWQVRQMVKYYLTYDYDEKYALYDLDRGKASVDEARNLASANGIICIESDRCLEMELMRLMSGDSRLIRRACRSSVEAKRVFAEFCHLKHLDDEVEWGRWISNERVNGMLEVSGWLDKIINVVRGGGE